jgi:hypothetical protein
MAQPRRQRPIARRRDCAVLDQKQITAIGADHAVASDRRARVNAEDDYAPSFAASNRASTASEMSRLE